MRTLILQSIAVCYCLLVTVNITAQTPTVGLRFYDNTTTDGYTLFTPESNEDVYLINNCGEKINKWIFTEEPGLTCYLLENGNLLRAGKNKLEIRDWDNNLIWSYSMQAAGLNQHHDIEPLPNGNILCLLSDVYSDLEMTAQGKDPSTVSSSFKLDKLIELQPVGTNSATIVWEWKFIDHIIQDYENTKPNFGVVIDHPELLDINYFDPNISNQGSDYTHVNGIDYNAALDQVIMSARNLSELYIIDHSTTTMEAAGHSGGNSNLGGDFLWRWGNPQVYKQGSIADQKLFLQHDSKWVEPGYLDQGKITVFNNGGDGSSSFSSIHLITPEIVNETYTKENNKFKPLDFEWSWNGSILGTTVLQGKKSGAHSLPNGNFIICETSIGQVSEITKSGTLIWTYKNPTSGATIFNQFDNTSGNGIFRAEKYPSNYIGFLGNDLTPQNTIENQNTISESCANSLGINDLEITGVNIVNPVKHGILRFNQPIKLDVISIIDINGKIVYSKTNFNGNSIPLNLKSSMYFVKLQKGKKIRYQKVIVQ